MCVGQIIMMQSTICIMRCEEDVNVLVFKCKILSLIYVNCRFVSCYEFIMCFPYRPFDVKYVNLLHIRSIVYVWILLCPCHASYEFMVFSIV
jgi:hypothetical protein